MIYFKKAFCFAPGDYRSVGCRPSLHVFSIRFKFGRVHKTLFRRTWRRK